MKRNNYKRPSVKAVALDEMTMLQASERGIKAVKEQYVTEEEQVWE